jgi:hypothetical protein
MATNCHKHECCQTEPALGDFGGFSIMGGDFPGGAVNGNNESSFIIDCPEGVVCVEGQYPVIVTIPEGTIVFPYATVPTGVPFVIQVPCGDGTYITKTLPANATNQEINTATQLALHEAAQCEAEVIAEPNPAIIAGGGGGGTYSNQPQEILCGDNDLKFNGDFQFGGGIMLNSEKVITIPGGLFFSNVSQAAADTKALETVQEAVDKAIEEETLECGYWNTLQELDCGYEVRTAEAYTFFSDVSQLQADEDALNSLGECFCSPVIEALTWIITTCDSGTAAGGAVSVLKSNGSFSTNIGAVNSSTFPGAFQCTFSGTYTVVGSVNFSIKESGYAAFIGGTSIPTGTYNFSVPYTFNAGSPKSIGIAFAAGTGDSIQLDLIIGPPP